MTYKSATQPFCRFCGGKIGKHTRTVWCEGSLQVPTTSYSRSVDAAPKTRAECQTLTNGQVISVHKGYRPERPIRSFSEWDGESYRDRYFCKDKCAISYAYSVAPMGHATKEYMEARQKSHLADKAKKGNPG